MKSLLYYLIQVTACSGILYGYYHFFLRNKKFHIYNRFYLLIAATISILIPFLNFPIYFSASETTSSFVLKTITSIPSDDFNETSAFATASIKNNFLSTRSLLFCCYVLISTIMIVRIGLSLRRIRQMRKKYTVQKLNSIYFINTSEAGTPFSFFRWLFWNQKIELRSEKGEQIFRHELFHIEQKHSFDILYLEFLATIFWINPFLHLIKKETKVIHEFLADQFAINQGGKWEYAELLLMQSLNTEQHLTNPFFYNQIKRRIAMITSSKKTSYKYLRKIMVLPVAAIVIALFAFSYKNKKANNSFTTLDKPVTVVIDAGHGVDAAGNHAGATASNGSHEDDIVLSIAKKIKELNTNDRLQIILTRENQDIVDLKKRVEFANSQKADLFISLHINAASTEEKNTKGMDILYSAKNRKYLAENKILATILYNYFYQIHSVNDITQPKNGVYVIDASHCPSVLVECGYLTDPNDLAFVKDESGQAQIAKSILQSIEQYFLQKEMPDWEQKKKTVSDTTWPTIKFSRNTATGKMEGSYNGKKFDKMSEYDGQFAFYFDDDSSTMIMISKEQTEALKKKYGKDLNELIIKDPGSIEKENREAAGLEEMLEQKKTESEKAEREFKLLMEHKQLEEEKEQSELKQKMNMNQLETEKAQIELKQLMALKQLENEALQLELKKSIDTMPGEARADALKELQLLQDEQRDNKKMQKEFELMLMNQQGNQEQLERSKKEYLLKEQKEKAQLEKSKKEFLINQQENQEQLERSKKEYLLKAQKEQAQLEKSKKESEAQKELGKKQTGNNQKALTKDSVSKQN
jgi:N-acetylmuramoyl-L-alanine amidase